MHAKPGQDCPDSRPTMKVEIAPMTTKLFFAIVWVVATLTTAPSSSASTGTSASDFIRDLGDKAIEVLRTSESSLEEREARFRTLLKDGFDIQFIGRFVLGKEWRRATPEQRSDYLNLFNEYILRTYSTRFGGYAGESLSIVRERPAGKRDVLVTTRIDRPGGQPIKADWRVRVIEGQHKIIDIMVQGVSMVLTQRSEFAALMKRGGVNGLIEALRARTDKFPATASAR